MRRLAPFCLVPVLLGLLLSGCEQSPTDSDPDPEPDVTVTAVFTVEPQEPEVGQEVTLDGTASSVENADDPSYDWQLETPSGSAATLDDPSAPVTTFVADEEGTYEATLEVSAEGVSDTQTASVEVEPAVVEISEDITEDRTLTADYLYRVTADIDVTAMLTIEPGTRIEFEEGTGFFIETVGGILVAEGTEEEPIVLTGTQETPGWWDGIWIGGTESEEELEQQPADNVVAHAVIEYAGSEALHPNTEAANLTVGRTNRVAAVSVRSTTLRHGAGHGLFIHLDSDLLDFASNTITGNDGAPVRARTHHGRHFDAASQYTGNGTDFVDLQGGTGAEIVQDVTWESLEVAYRLSERTDVDDAVLSIDAGAELAFRQDARLDIEPGAALAAEGAPDSRITFTGTDEIPGWWGGLMIESDHRSNLLDHVVVEYGGSEPLHSNTEAANVTVGHTLRQAALRVRNTTLRHGAGHGLYVHLDSDLYGFETNTITNNAGAPVRARSHHGRHFDAASDYAGNGEDFVDVDGGTGAEIDQDVLWESLGVPYRAGERIDVDAAELTLEEGTEIVFREEGQLDIQPGGALISIGTEQDSIRITGTNESAGWWNGIFIKSINPNNRIEYTVVAHGGREPLHANTEASNLTVARTLRDAVAVVANSMFRNSAGWGIWIHDNGETNHDICVANDFEENAAGDCRRPPSD